jgi:hypothetical protein
MEDRDNSPEQLAAEVTHLRRRIAELEAAKTGPEDAEEALRKSGKSTVPSSRFRQMGSRLRPRAAMYLPIQALPRYMVSLVRKNWWGSQSWIIFTRTTARSSRIGWSS